jgi:transketolase
MTVTELEISALNMRKAALKMAFDCGSNAHLGGGLSIIDILAALYGNVMNCKNKHLPYAEKDKFILSKGHGVLALYSALAEFDIIDKELLTTFQKNGSDLIAHPVMNTDLGIESSNGSLGQGLSMGVGLALSAKKKNRPYKTYVVCGNGECNEGSVWEAVMSAVNFKLDNLTVIIDNNHMQSDGESKNIINIRSLQDGFASFGFDTTSVNGHDIEALLETFSRSGSAGKPSAIIAETVKGKGVSFMENNSTWHHNRLTESQYLQALSELEDSE